MRKGITACAVAIALGTATGVGAQPGNSNSGPFGFDPISGSAAGDGSDFNQGAPWIIPEGFTQTIVSSEYALNIYQGNDWHDMNTVNETGRQAGRYLYRTHEVRRNADGGAVSVVDLATGGTKIIDQDPSYDALDGIEWTPWGTILFAEEVTDGRLFEIVLEQNDPTAAAAVLDRPAVGRLAHEGIAVGPDGSVYVVDEFRGEREGFGGGVYRFVPDRRGDLSSGRLYVLGVSGGAFGTGQGTWLGPINPSDARNAGTAAGGTGYNRPEDLEIIGDTLYVAITEGPRAGGSAELFDGRIIAVNLNSLTVTDFVKPGLNVPIEANGATGFDNPDNLAQTPDGRLIIVEDNVPSDIWIADRDHDGDGVADAVWHFASLTDSGAEGTGIYFGQDPKTMFVNVQHSLVNDGDATWAITKN